MGNKHSVGNMTPQGWYSRRHPTKESHDAQVERHNKTHFSAGPMYPRPADSPRQQLFRLDMRLGANQGAKKERARLAALIIKPD